MTGAQLIRFFWVIWNTVWILEVKKDLLLLQDRAIFSVNVVLLKAQICMIYFQTCTQIFGIHKALIHVKR